MVYSCPELILFLSNRTVKTVIRYQKETPGLFEGILINETNLMDFELAFQVFMLIWYSLSIMS